MIVTIFLDDPDETLGGDNCIWDGDLSAPPLVGHTLWFRRRIGPRAFEDEPPWREGQFIVTDVHWSFALSGVSTGDMPRQLPPTLYDVQVMVERVTNA